MAQNTQVSLKGIINFRDVGYTVNQFLGNRKIREGLIFRSARPDDATPLDKKYLVDNLGVKTVIDLRTKTELLKQAEKRQKLRSRDPTLPESAHIENMDYHEIKLTGPKFERYIGSLMTWWQFFKFILLTIFRYRIEALQIVSQNILVPRGLLGLARTMLDLSGDEIAEALSLYTSQRTTPVLVHCTQGKDRTGLICALVLMILDVPTAAIEHDYFLSNQGLAAEREMLIKEVTQIGLTEEWVGTSKDMIVGIRQHLDDKYGGLVAYLDGIGFDSVQRTQLRETLLY